VYTERAVSVFDRDDFNATLFYPRADTTPPPPGARDLFVDVGEAHIHVRRHAGTGAPTLLLFHGNGEVVADYDAAAARFARAGVALAVADYRGYGASEGEPTLRAVIADARPIAEAVADGPLFVMGRSLGGAAAHELYARPVAGTLGVILESAFFDLRGLVRRRGIAPPAAFSAGELALYDPAPKLAAGRLPLLVLHGEADTLIAVDEARAAFAAAGTPDKQLVTIPGHGHNDVSAAPAYWDALAAFVARL